MEEGIEASDFGGLQVRQLVPDDLELICRHREAMFLEAGGDPAALRVMTERVGSCSSRHQMTSVRSPNVQHIAMPAPLSISAPGWASTGTSTPNRGVVTVVPNRPW